MIPHNRLTTGAEESAAADRVIKSGWLAQGREVEAFENEICEFLGLEQKSAIAVSSGSSALYLALKMLKLSGAVTAPSYTCAAIRNAINLAGLTEKLVDNESGTSSMNVSDESIQNSSATVVVHNFGIPGKLPTHPQPVIEDCAQAIGASRNGKYVGTLGKLGIFSFYATKMITSGGQGGMVVSKDRDIIDQIRDYRLFDCRYDDEYRFNFQMTDLQAAIGRVQLKRLPEFLRIRKEIFDEYQNISSSFLKSNDSSVVSSNYRAVLITSNQKEVIEHLKLKSIGCIIPIEDRELMGIKNSYPNALEMANKTVSIPIYPTLTSDERRRISVELKELKQRGLIS